MGHAQGRYEATSAWRTDTVVHRDYVCQIRSVQHIEVRALEKGYLQDIMVDEGQRVHVGQLLFRIRPVLYQAEVQRAQAELEYAEIEYRNTKVLADSNVVSPNELAMAKARMEKARAELSIQQAHLGFTEIKAPFDGIMGRFHVRKGSLLDEGELLTELSDNSQMWVYFNVPEAEYLSYTQAKQAGQGTEVELRLANGDLFKERATLSQGYDGGRFGRFGRYSLGAEMALGYPLGIGPLQFTKFFPEDTHNSFLNAFMSGGWLSGVCYLTLISTTIIYGVRYMFADVPWRMAYLTVFTAFFATAAEGFIIDTDHWRHLFLLIGAAWGLIAANRIHLGSHPAIHSAAYPVVYSAGQPAAFRSG